MRLNLVTWIGGVLFLCSHIALAGAAPVGLEAKQLSGPPEDFLSMRLSEDRGAATESRHVFFSFDAQSHKSGVWRHTMGKGAEGEYSAFLFVPESGWNARIRPAHKGLSEPWEAVHKAEQAGLPGLGDGYQVLELAARAEQAVEMLLETETRSRTDAQRALLWVEYHSPLTLSLASDSWRTVAGEAVRLSAELVHEAGTDVAVEEMVAEALLLDPQRGSRHLTGDELRVQVEQGRVDLSFLPERAGTYAVQLTLHAVLASGEFVQRTVHHPVWVVEPWLVQGKDQAVAKADLPTTRLADGESLRLQLELPFLHKSARLDRVQKILTHAELWGTGPDGQWIPVAWTGGMRQVGPEQDLNLSMDSQWLRRAGAVEPFELRHLRLQDPETATPMVQLKRVPLSLSAELRRALEREASKGPVVAISEEMRMGPRPSWLGHDATKAQPQETILLVHGYCSGDVWAPFESHFFPEPVWRFLDRQQARSNDQFAQLISDTMTGVSFFSTVAHSQGGMASLHLLNYYWSGLDNSDGARPIQSIGTPYKGTYMAQLQNVLGFLINTPCPNVPELTRSGAAQWLAGIAPAARNKVYYYRTRGLGLSPCHWAASTIIGGRDDGLVSEDDGVLSGGHSTGVVKRQCHTDDMRHRFQLDDWGRNRQRATYARIFVPDPLEACATHWISYPPLSVFADLNVNASCSTVQSGFISSYNWTLRDVTSGIQVGSRSGQTATFGSLAPGTYELTLSVWSQNPTLNDTHISYVYVPQACTTSPLGGGQQLCLE